MRPVRMAPRTRKVTDESTSLISHRRRTTDATMTQDTQVRRLHARVLTKRTTPGILLNDDDFRFAADCERMRVDRNGSTLSLLLIRLPSAHATPRDVAFMARLLEGRLRVTASSEEHGPVGGHPAEQRPVADRTLGHAAGDEAP